MTRDTVSVWHARTPQRYPDVIVQARDADDVASAIRYARAAGHQVGVRSGGRSWAGNHVRDSGLLRDVSGLTACTVDPERMVAVVGPGLGGSVLAAELDSQGLFFPTGHCKAWVSAGRVLGPACESVLAVDVVTADREQIHCDADSNSDLYWAARGSGPWIVRRRDGVSPNICT